MKSVKSEFNMSSEIRSVLSANPNATSAECVSEIKGRHPKSKINMASFSVAFYTTRQRMGITHKRPGSKSRVVSVAKSTGMVGLNVMRSAAEFVRAVGGFDNALSAIKTVESVQLK